MELKDKAKEIRKELKSLGITTKQVKIKTEILPNFEESIDAIIKDVSISTDIILPILKKYSVFRNDGFGEVLQGCNVYTSVEYDDDIVREMRKEFLEKAKTIYEKGKEYKGNENMIVYEDNKHEILYMPNRWNCTLPHMELCDKTTGKTIMREDVNCMQSIAEMLLFIKYLHKVDISA